MYKHINKFKGLEMDNDNPVSYGTMEALLGLKSFLKKEKTRVYKKLDINLYTIARNVINDKKVDPTNISKKELEDLKEYLLTELAYLNNVLVIDVAFYLPTLTSKKETDNAKPKRVTKSMLIMELAIKLANHAKGKVKIRKPSIDSIILTNTLAGITNLNNPILRSFTGDVIHKREHYKLLKRSPPIKVTKDLLKIFGDDFSPSIKGKMKEVNKLLGLIKETPFKGGTEINSLINDIVKG